MRLSRLACLSAVLFGFSAIPAYAQVHECDKVQPTTGAYLAGTATVLKLCEPVNDQNGNPITNFKVYDNGTPVTVPMVRGTAPNSQGLYEFAAPYTVPGTSGVHTLEVSALSGTIEGLKSLPFVLTVSLPPVAPPAPVKLHLSPAP